MTKTSPSLQVAVVDHSAIIRIQGRANFTASVSFKRLLGELREHGFGNLLLDLSECVTMDSTFLGVLAGTAARMSEPPKEPRNTHLRLLNPNPRVTDLLENLGVSHLFQTVHCRSPIVSQQANSPTSEVTPSREEVSQVCLDAHRALMEINPANIPKFKDVVQFLAEDLKKANSDGKADPGDGTQIGEQSAPGK